MAGIRAVFFLIGAAMAVFTPFIAVLLSSRGFSPAAIGVVTAAASLAFTIAIPAWSHLADVTLGRRRALVVAGIGSAACVLAAGLPLPAVLLGACFVGFSAFESSWGPLSDALAVNAVRHQARAYGRIRLLSSLGFALTTAAAGFLYDRTGYGPAYVLFFVLALVLAAAAVFAPDIARADLGAIARQAGEAEGRPARGGSFGLALRVQPRLAGVLVAILPAHVGIMAGFTYLPLRIVDLGGQPSDVALSAAVSGFAEIPPMLLAGAIMARVGLRGLFALSTAVYGACFVAWVVADAPAVIIVSRVATGLAYGGMWLASVLTMTVLLPPRLQATGQGLYQVTAFGLAAILANLLGGVVYGSVGPGALFGGAAALAVVSSGAALAWLPRRGETPVDAEPAFEAPLPLAPTTTG